MDAAAAADRRSRSASATTSSSEPAVSNRKPRVVIIGSGFAGLRVLHGLGIAQFDITVVDEKNYFEYYPSTLSCLVDPQHANRTILELKRPGVKFVHERFTKITSGVVETASGTTIPFDYCVIATGSRYPEPVKAGSAAACAGTATSRRRDLAAYALAIARAPRIILLGAGPVGVELAAEIAGHFGGEKAVTLRTRGKRILEDMDPSASAYAAAWLKSRNVDIVTEYAKGAPSDEHGALVIQCYGDGPSTASGQPIRCSRTMMADFEEEGCAPVFACGDVADVDGHPVDKVALTAEVQASLVVRNILSTEKGAPLARFPEDVCYGRIRLPDVMCVSLHKYDAVMQVNGRILRGRLPALVKGMIEQFQLAMADGNAAAWAIWLTFEKITLFVFSGG